jgi:hypothetical protein
VKRIYISDEAYKLLVEYAVSQRGSVRGISVIASQLIIDAVSQKTSRPIDQKPISPTSPESQKASSPIDQKATDRTQSKHRSASQAQIDTIMEIAWEIATWSDIAPILEHKLEFKIPDNLNELTSQQASQIIQTLKDLKKPLANEQIKEAKELLEKLAQKQNLKPEDLASKLNIPQQTSQLRLYHLELLKQLAIQDPSLIPHTQNKEGETK